jgi:hypothetical protein
LSILSRSVGSANVDSSEACSSLMKDMFEGGL